VPTRLTRTLNCRWAPLAEALDEHVPRYSALEWYWATRGTVPVDPVHAHGLVVYRVTSGGSSSSAQVLHCSSAETDWRRGLSDLLEAFKEDIFQRLAISSIRASLWYRHDKASKSKLVLDPEVHGIFKEAGFRWFQLFNAADGSRVQVLERRRRDEDHLMSQEQRQEFHDLAIRLVTLVPSLAASEDVNIAQFPSKVGAMANPHMVAECLKRHTTFTAKSEPGQDDAAADNMLSCIISKLKMAGDQDISIFWSREILEIEECVRFVEQNCGDLHDALVTEIRQNLVSLRHQKLQPQFDSLLCIGTGLLKDWRLRHYHAKNPAGLQVLIQGMGTSPSLPTPLAYFAMEDEAVFIVVWKCPEEQEAAVARDPYRHSYEVLQAVAPLSDPLPFREVLLPRVRVRSCKTAATGPTPLRTSTRCLGAPLEVIELELSGGRKMPGALKPADPRPGPQQLWRLQCPFMMCVWHSNLDVLDIPLFAALVQQSDCLAT